ncbi:MAG TPA: NAD(P)/FAD-dependent oxidoreductase [Streptosporangiaceae bacterium]
MTRTRTALIAGSGIAGPAAAMALRKAGIEPVVYEAHTGSAEGIGAFLTLATNGVDALRTLGADGPAVASGFPTTTNTLWSGTGKKLGASAVSMTLADGTTGYTLKRADLYRALQDQAASRGIRIEHGKRLVGAEPADGGVRARFADGTHATGEILIGCDGIHSTVRAIIDPAAPAPSYAGLINLGGYVRGVRLAADPCSYHMIFGKRAFFGYALAPDGEVWWFANVPEPTEPARGSLTTIGTSEWRQRLTALFADDAGPAVQLIQATSHDLAASPVHTVPHLPTWHTDRMIVVGDAAHAPSPTSGQGASLAIEDAVLLAKCLRDLPTPGQAFTAFEQLRRPRAEQIIKQAARINSNKAATGAVRVLRDVMMPVMMPLFVRFIANGKPGRQLYGYHIDWDTPAVSIGK